MAEVVAVSRLTDDIISEYQPAEPGRTDAPLVLAAKVGPLGAQIVGLAASRSLALLYIRVYN